MEKVQAKNITSTKTTCPRSNLAISRYRLFERLDKLRINPVIWISGPPGSGKTTLSSTYIAERNVNYIWYQLDSSDIDIANFFHYLRQAIQQTASRCHRQALPLLTPEYMPGLTTFTRMYAEAIVKSIKLPAMIVLDNYEQVHAKASLHEVIREMASSLPPEICTLVLSRTEPPPAFARMRLHGELEILSGGELNLTMDEAQVLTEARQQQTVIPLDAGQITRVHMQSKGWVAGFMFLLTNNRELCESSRELGENQQLVFDYFATELFGHFSPAVQQGLLRTALLPVMTIPNVTQLTGDQEIAAVLADLQRRNCFVVQCGQTEPVYEYHALFRAFLLNRAIAIIPPDEWRNLQHRAAGLLAADIGQVDAAVNLYQTVNDWPGLAALALREAPALISAGRHQTLEQWLSCLPADLFNQSPWLYYWQGMARLPFNPADARIHFEEAYAGFNSKDEAEGLYSAWAGIMDTFFYEWQDLRPADRWIAEFEELRARYPEFPSRAVELRTYWAMGALLHRQPQHRFVPVWAERANAILNSGDQELSVLLGGYRVAPLRPTFS
ncbi:MAG: hypothetical protein PHY16_15665 [Methylobacter sp.]|nr:hypothetical protein [Methylobacter sp.]